MQFISPILWDDAVDTIGDKTPIGSALTSEEWSQIPLALRQRAFFSATIESVRFLQNMRDGITDFLSRSVEDVGGGQTALKEGSRQQFIANFSDLAIRMGLGPLDASKAGTIEDITSEGRLGLIFDTMTQSANDYSYWKQGQNPDVLDEFPAQQFIRERDVKTPRPVHQENEGVVRLKTDLDFWMAMNDPSFGGFGVPWGPWGFNSGMGVEDTDRETAEQLGLLDPGDTVQPVEKDFNDRLEASTRGLDDDMKALLKKSFGDQVEMDDEEDVVRWAGTGTAPEEAPPETSPEPEAEPDAVTPGKESLTLDDVLGDLGLDADQTATAGDMTALREELKEEEPVQMKSMVKYVKGAQPGGVLTDENISKVTQDFLDFIPAENMMRLPKLKIEVVKDGNFMGQYAPGGTLQLNAAALKDPQRLRRTLFHELMHWLHREGGAAYQKAIADHFEERTDRERIRKLTPYSAYGKKDDWYDAYAGAIYPFEMVEGDRPGGLEVPTRYIEWLARSPEEMAQMWNEDPKFRETMKIVLHALF